MRSDMSGTGFGITRTALAGIVMIPDIRVRDALAAAYATPEGAAAVGTAERVFARLVFGRPSPDVVARFVAGWRATHSTALYVSGLIVRLLREAGAAAAAGRHDLTRAAAALGEVIGGDTGVDDDPHDELFARFADHLVGDDRWRATRFSVPGCERFREYVRDQRVRAPVEHAVLTTLASENWNSGEYTHFDAVLRSCGSVSDARDDTADPLAYVRRHAGETERDHFLNALSAWEWYCRAHGRTPDPSLAGEMMRGYLTELGRAWVHLEHAVCG